MMTLTFIGCVVAVLFIAICVATYEIAKAMKARDDWE